MKGPRSGWETVFRERLDRLDNVGIEDLFEYERFMLDGIFSLLSDLHYNAPLGAESHASIELSAASVYMLAILGERTVQDLEEKMMQVQRRLHELLAAKVEKGRESASAPLEGEQRTQRASGRRAKPAEPPAQDSRGAA